MRASWPIASERADRWSWSSPATTCGWPQLAEALAFFAPEIERIELPAWDCLPYDRVSPNPEIVSRRIDTLSRLASEPAAGAGRASC